ncbi:MAG: signal peptidase I [Micrococcales bacterium]|nr:signal peptidase I [Micrococcales bacterium]
MATAVLAAGLVVPRLAGADTYTVTSDSMTPALPVGTLVVVRRDRPVGLGDIITYQRSSGTALVVTHRVVGVGLSTDGRPAYTTRGDANTATDPGYVRPEQVRGVLWYQVPHLGRLAALVTTSQRQGAVTVLAGLLIAYASWQLVQALRERRTPFRAARHVRTQPRKAQDAAAHDNRKFHWSVGRPGL